MEPTVKEKKTKNKRLTNPKLIIQTVSENEY